MKATQVNETTIEMNVNQKWEFYTEECGWTYIPDPTTWSGGTWYRDDLGTVNKGGGTFENIQQAVAAMDNHYRNWARLERVA